jgi:glyoxylase-like metal-dependent hydrolase (beta-lactamase superfamily II)
MCFIFNFTETFMPPRCLSNITKVKALHTKEIGKNLYQVELETGGFKNLFCSYILKGAKIIIVESGPTSSVPRLVDGLKELNLRLEDVEYLAVTHVHLDHGGGAGTLLKALPNAKVIVHPRGMPHLINPQQLWESAQSVLGYVSEIFGKPEPVPKERIIPVIEGSFDLDGRAKLKVIETVGHASHNLSFHESFNNGIFPGDAAGTYFPEFDVVMPTAPPPFRLDLALASLDRLISFNPSFLYYSHFGKASNAVRRLEDYKLQLQLWAKIVEEGLKENQSVDEIRNRIVAQDKVMRQLAGYLRSHRVYSKTALGNTVQGVIEYVKQAKQVS